MPTTWDEFFVAADALKKAGIVPVAHGGQNWQEFELFETVALGVGGADFYRKAFVQLDPATLRSATMQKSLVTFKRIKGYVDRNAPGRDWNLATAMVIRGEAGMQFMGDWAKGEFVAAGKLPGKDFGCVAAPGTQNAYTYNVDSFAMFKIKDRGQPEGAAGSGRRDHVARVPGSLQPGTRARYQCVRGCRSTSSTRAPSSRRPTSPRRRRTAASCPRSRTTWPCRPAVEGAMKDVISNFWNDDQITPAAVMRPAGRRREGQVRAAILHALVRVREIKCNIGNSAVRGGRFPPSALAHGRSEARGARPTRPTPWPPCTARSTCGVNFFDTADVYGDGRSERLIARLRAERSEPFYVATKAGRRLSPHVADGYNRANLTAFVERSLLNLNVEAIDLLQLHCPPSQVFYMPEVFGVLDDLVSAGKLRYYGVSVEKVEEALKAIEYPGVQIGADRLQPLPPAPCGLALSGDPRAPRRHSCAAAAVVGHALRALGCSNRVRAGRPPQLQS